MNELLDQESREKEPESSHPETFDLPMTKPLITYLIIGICAVIFVFLNVADTASIYKYFVPVFIPVSIQIWSGAYWGLITSAFVHFDFWHILFNMWWLKDFGKFLEPTMGRARYILLITASAVISSGSELAVADQTGIGFSGVIYAMFGYALATRNVETIYKQIVTKKTTQWLLGWLILCIILTRLNIWNVGNAAHVSGFLFGYCVGNIKAQVRVNLSKIVLTALTALVILSAVYMPWSDIWRVKKAASDGDRAGQFNYAMLLLQIEKKQDSLLLLRKSADQDYLPAMNHLAWMLATDGDDAIRNGIEAVKWAEAVCEENNWEYSEYIDTLAAAYAEVQRWDDAVKTQKLAISKLTNEDAEKKEAYESRLQKYLRHEKARE